MQMRIEVDEELLRTAQQLIGAATRCETVEVALQELVARQRRVSVLDLRGRVRWSGALDEARRPRA